MSEVKCDVEECSNDAHEPEEWGGETMQLCKEHESEFNRAVDNNNYSKLLRWAVTKMSDPNNQRDE